MSNSWAFTCKTCSHRYKWQGLSNPIPPCPKCVKATAAPPAPRRGISARLTTDAYDEAMELIEAIGDAAGEVPERGESFAASVLETATDMRATIERMGDATEAQLTALRNMLSGLERWAHD